MNSLVNAFEDGHSPKKVKETLDFLVNYAVWHFSDEETLQQECDYPGFKEHRQMHEEFKVNVGDLVRRFYDSGSTLELSSEVNDFLIGWLINHVTQEDKKIVDHIRK